MGEELNLFREKGRHLPAHDTDDFDFEQYRCEVDFEKFNRGRNFFKKNMAQCLLAMLFSLVGGLSVSNLLDVLVATGKSSTARTSLKRYLSTLRHILKWHYGNVWDNNSDASASIQQVRDMHCSARKLMSTKCGPGASNCPCRIKNTGDMLHVSQYDMALVQCGFMGTIILYPCGFGIKCSRTELEDYVYFWRWIGVHLGMDDEFNLCLTGYDNAYRLCKAIERDVLFPALNKPPQQYFPMARAFTDGINMFSYIQIYSPHSVMAQGYELAGRALPFQISLKDKCRQYFIKLIIFTMYHIPAFTRLLNRNIEKLFKCDIMT